MRKLACVATLFSSIICVQGVMAAEAITIMGDPCTVPLAKKLGAAFTKKTGKNVEVDGSSCGSGIYKASQGDVDTREFHNGVWRSHHHLSSFTSSGRALCV